MRVDPLLEQYPVRIREVTLGVILGISIFVKRVFLRDFLRQPLSLQEETVRKREEGGPRALGKQLPYCFVHNRW